MHDIYLPLEILNSQKSVIMLKLESTKFFTVAIHPPFLGCFFVLISQFEKLLRKYKVFQNINKE